MVVDASVALAWFFEESHTPLALEVLLLADQRGFLVPTLWWSELANGLVAGERRSRTSPERADQFIALIRNLPIRTDNAPPEGICDAIVGLARERQLSAYDAAYLERARRTASELASFDARLRTAALSIGVAVVPRP